MKIRRQKNARRVLTYFKVEFGIEAPYSVLLDATFCRAALRCQLNISEQLPKYLNSRVQCFTTQCVLNECESFGTLLYGVLKVLRQFRVEPCCHEPKTASSQWSAADCILATLQRRKRPCLAATNDHELTEKVRDLRKVPLLFVSHNAISIEKPAAMRNRNAQSEPNQSGASQSAAGNMQMTEHERKQLNALFKREFPERVKMQRIRTKLQRLKDRRKARSGPNPLSCKKKKKSEKKRESASQNPKV